MLAAEPGQGKGEAADSAARGGRGEGPGFSDGVRNRCRPGPIPWAGGGWWVGRGAASAAGAGRSGPPLLPPAGGSS